MELIVFWLLPVVLLTVLILLALQIIRHNQRPRLYVVEPINLLVCDWKVARYEPDSQAVADILHALAGANLSKGTLLEQIITKSASLLKSKPINVTINHQRLVGPLAEQFTLMTGSQKKSIVVGPLEQIEEFIEDEKLVKYRTLAQKSVQNGYLALIFATAFVHGKGERITKHQIEGLVILESVVDPTQLNKISKHGQEQIRFLTVAPLEYARHIFEGIFSDKAVFGLNAKELETLLPPKFAESDLVKASVIGGADLIARHQTLRVWQRQFDCVVVSRNPEDCDLPVTPLQHIS